VNISGIRERERERERKRERERERENYEEVIIIFNGLLLLEVITISRI